jgi:hypothetical protein
MKLRIRTFKPSIFLNEQLCDSEKESGLNTFKAFCGLMSCSDREGRFPWMPRRIKNLIMPEENIAFEEMLNILWRYDLIEKYKHQDKIYGFIPTFKRHQVINKREPISVLPDVEDGEIIDYKTQESKSLHCNARVKQTKARGEVEVEGKGSGIHLSATLQGTVSRSVVSIPLIDGTEHNVTELDIEEYTKTYPAVDIKEQLLLIRAWNRDNPRNRKTKKGIARHIGTWLADKQNKARRPLAYAATEQHPQAVKANLCKFKGCNKESIGEWNRVAYCKDNQHKEWAKNL